VQHPEGAELCGCREWGGIVGGQGAPRGSEKSITWRPSVSGCRLDRFDCLSAWDPTARLARRTLESTASVRGTTVLVALTCFGML
jgi:hypothetical protein